MKLEAVAAHNKKKLINVIIPIAISLVFLFQMRNCHLTDRSSHLRCSVRKCVLRSFAKFTGKQLCHSRHANTEQIKIGRTFVSDLVNLVSP